MNGTKLHKFHLKNWVFENKLTLAKSHVDRQFYWILNNIRVLPLQIVSKLTNSTKPQQVFNTFQRTMRQKNRWRAVRSGTNSWKNVSVRVWKWTFCGFLLSKKSFSRFWTICGTQCWFHDFTCSNIYFLKPSANLFHRIVFDCGSFNIGSLGW